MGALAANPYVAEIAKLRAENELLRAENWQLKDKLSEHEAVVGGEFIWGLQKAFKLAPAPARMLAVIVKWPQSLITKDQIWVRAFDDRDDRDAKVIDIYLVRIRRALALHGLVIETLWSKGLRMSADSKATIQRMVEAQEEQ